MKKINGIISILLFVVLMGHVFTSVNIGNEMIPQRMFFAVLTLLLIPHIIISFLNITNNNEGKFFFKYAKFNLPLLAQRISSFVILLLLPCHIIIFGLNDKTCG